MAKDAEHPAMQQLPIDLKGMGLKLHEAKGTGAVKALFFPFTVTPRYTWLPKMISRDCDLQPNTI